MSSRLVPAVAISALVLASLVWVGSPTVGQAPQSKQPSLPIGPIKTIPPLQPAWEYKQVTGGYDEKKFNDLGADGWELMPSPNANFPFFMFKRPKR